MERYIVHPFADAFPSMTDTEINELAEDVKKNGLITPIIVKGNVLLDGRHRLKACIIAGVEPTIREYTGSDDELEILSLITSLNIHRRHLNPSQKAFVGAKMMGELSLGARERQRLAGMATQFIGKNEDGTSKLRVVPNLEQPEESNQLTDNIEDIEQEKSALMEKGRAVEIAAKAVGVSKQYIYEAQKIEEERPDKAKQVVLGQKSINQVKKEIADDLRSQKKQDQSPDLSEAKPVLVFKYPKKKASFGGLIALVDRMQMDDSLPEDLDVEFTKGADFDYEVKGS